MPKHEIGNDMGEAKRKKRRKAEYLERHPLCCYCGGTTPASTVDHVPSRQMFTGRRRPKGLEVPAYEACNSVTRLDEQVAAMIGRVFPDGITVEEQDEVRKILQAIRNNNPGLLEELQPTQRQIERFSTHADVLPDNATGVLNCQGPLLNRSIRLFGAKLGFALHYCCTGRIVPKDGGVAVRWFTNFDRFTGDLPEELFQILGSPETLRQGKWQVNDQFEYASAISEMKNMAAYFSTFRQSFVVLSWVNENAAAFAGPDATDICQPGFIFETHEE